MPVQIGTNDDWLRTEYIGFGARLIEPRKCFAAEFYAIKNLDDVPKNRI